MADMQVAGFACEFVTKPPDAIQSECPVCLQVLREPYQVTCCGYSFCRDCIERVTDAGKSPCPCCNTTKFEYFPNKGLRRSLYEFKVYCANQSQGCQWIGGLGQLTNHLNIQALQSVDGCQYVQVPCSYCSKRFQRLDIVVHQNDDCGMRPYRCEHCNTFKSNYNDVIINHQPVCSYFPVPCTNECGEFFCRQYLENHIVNDCPLTIVDCDFKHIGCKERFPRNKMSEHLTKGIDTHLSLQASEQQNFVVKFETEIQQLGEKQVSPHQIEMLTQGMKQLYQNTASLALLTKASHYDHKTSMETEQAEMRKVNQRINELSKEKKIYAKNLKEKKQNDTIFNYFIVVVLAVIVALLLYRCEDLEEKNKIIKQQIDELAQDPWAIPRKHNMLSYPVEVTMTNFSKYKNNNSYWNSVPFYTHLKGYKLFLKVYANGDGIGKNTHVSVFITIMQGEFDHRLKWPFQGEFNVSLLNQEEDNGHRTTTIHFDDTVPDHIANRKKEREPVKWRGWGMSKFILHSHLQPKYLKNDCLKLRIETKL